MAKTPTNTPHWRKQNAVERKREIGELRRTAKHLNMKFPLLRQAFDAAELEDLGDADWEVMDNTHSIGAWTKARVIKVIGDTRNHEDIFRGLENGEEMPVPIVLFREGQTPYLIGGNTRLLACKALGIRPKILAVRM